MSGRTSIADTIEFKLTPIDRAVAELLPEASPPGKWPAFNAVRHPNRAWRIREIDPEMSAFRSITAEEEAASAVFLALKRRHYVGAKGLNHREHFHKAALVPFCKAVAARLSPLSRTGVRVRAFVDETRGRRRLHCRWYLGPPLIPTEVVAVQPAPLHFSVSERLGATGSAPMRLAEFMGERAGGIEVLDLANAMHERANFRNLLLYASSEGYYKIDNIDEGLEDYKRSTFNTLALFLLIDAYSRRQSFVQQCLNEFLLVLGKVPPDVLQSS
jgi:hypothetical protein